MKRTSPLDDVSEVCSLLDQGADTEIQNNRGQTALILALAENREVRPPQRPRSQQDLVTSLVDAGADVDACDAAGDAPIHVALRSNSIVWSF